MAAEQLVRSLDGPDASGQPTMRPVATSIPQFVYNLTNAAFRFPTDEIGRVVRCGRLARRVSTTPSTTASVGNGKCVLIRAYPQNEIGGGSRPKLFSSSPAGGSLAEEAPILHRWCVCQFNVLLENLLEAIAALSNAGFAAMHASSFHWRRPFFREALPSVQIGLGMGCAPRPAHGYSARPTFIQAWRARSRRPPEGSFSLRWTSCRKRIDRICVAISVGPAVFCRLVYRIARSLWLVVVVTDCC